MTLPAFTLHPTATNAAAPFCLGHAFKKGDVPAGSQVVAPFSDFQCTPKNAWPDGSLKFAILSGRASVTGTTPLSSQLSIGTPTAGTAIAASSITAVATVDCGTFGAVTWSGSDWASPFSTWVSGPKMSSFIYRKPVGSDPHLVAWLEVRLWSGGELEVLPWIENGYLMVAGPTNKSATYSFTLGGTQRFSSSLDFLHHTRSPLVSGTMLSHWLGAAPGVTPRHDVAYMQASELVPTYSASTTTTAVDLSASATYTPFQVGGFYYIDRGYGGDNMANSGYQKPIGLLPAHDVAYIVCSDNPALTYGAVVRNGYSAGRYPIHYRDETTNRPLRISQYPLLALGNGSAVNQAGSTNGGYTPDATVGAHTWDAAHHPSVGYMAYLVTGRWYFVEEVQFCTTLNYLARNQVSRGSGQNLLTPDLGGWQTRTTAWNWRTLTQALAITPDSDTALRNEFIASVQNNIDYYWNVYVGQTNNPYGMVEPSEYYDAGTRKYQSPWQQDFLTGAWGYSVAMGLPLSTTYQTKLEQFFQWKAKSVVLRLGTSAGFWYINADAYVMRISSVTNPDYVGGTGPWLASDAAVYAATYDPAVSAEVSTSFAWLGSTNGTLCGEIMPGADSLWGNLHPAIAYAVRFAVPGASAAYARLTNASNYSALTSQFASVPVWGIVPSGQTSTPGATLMTPGPSAAFDTTPLWGANTAVFDTHQGLGIPLSEVPAGGTNGTSVVRALIQGGDSAASEARVRYISTPVGFAAGGDTSYTSPAGAVNYEVYLDGASLGQATDTIGAASTVTGVTVSPSTATGSTTFTATVQGANSPSQAVTWTRSGTAGSINASTGAFVAPSQTSVQQIITITATSTQSGTTGTATVTIAAAAPGSSITAVTVSPTTITQTTGTIQFTPAVTGTGSFSTALTRTASAGSINSSNLFTLPAQTSSVQTVTLTWTSVQDNTKPPATATVTIPASITPPVDQAATRVNIVLETPGGALVVNNTNIHYAFFAQSSLESLVAPIKKGSTLSTDGNAVLDFDITGLTGMLAGDVGVLALSNPDFSITTLCHVTVQ